MNNFYKNVLLIAGCVFIIVFLLQCTNKDATSNRESNDFQVIDLGETTKGSNSFLDISQIIKLQTIEDGLVGEIDQLEIYENKIFILDRKTNNFFVFNKSGQLYKKISADAGPQGFIAPRSFWIDSDGFVLLLDVNLNKLIKYTSSEVEFVETINLEPLNWSSPVTFGIIPEKNLYVYYYLHNEKNKTENKQIVLSKDNSSIQNLFLDGNATGTIMFGFPANFYILDNKLMFYPYFSNKIYEIDSDRLIPKYELLFHNLNFPEESIFLENPGTKRFMAALAEKDYVQYMSVFETDKALFVNYLVGYDKFMGIYDKINNRVKNQKVRDITDDLGLGNDFPVPVSVYENKFVGIVSPGNIDKTKLGNTNFIRILDDLKEDDNPILVVYTVNI